MAADSTRESVSDDVDREGDLGTGSDEQQSRFSRAVPEYVSSAPYIGDLICVAYLVRNILPGEHETRGSVTPFDRITPGDCRLDIVAGAPDAHVRHDAQTGNVLDRLVRRPVLAQANRIVRVHEDIL